MPLLPLSPDELLSTTRAVRRRLDFQRPVERDVIMDCLRLAQQAPTGSNSQNWHFVVVTDAAKRAALGAVYRRAFEVYRGSPMYAGARRFADAERQATQQRVASSADFLAERMGDVPVHVVPCLWARLDEMPPTAITGALGSILPATWSFMLAARARGLGTCWTTLHLMFTEEAAGILGIPDDRVTQVALIPVAYTKGTDFKPAHRESLDGIVHWEQW